MRDKRKITFILVAAILMAVLASGCGSSDSSTSADSAGGSSEPTGNATFLKKGSKNKIAAFGQEADEAEREAASSVLEENLQARAIGDWAAQCSSLTAIAVKKIEEESATLGAKGCPESLETQAQPVAETKAIRANTMTGPIAALRVEGIKAFALYHGAEGVNYAMPMTNEGDEWKVSSLVTLQLPKP